MLGLTARSTFDQVAEAIIVETKRRGYTPMESIAALSTAIQESGLRPGAVSSNGLWRGIYQQDQSYPGRDDPNTNIFMFLDRLDVKRGSQFASDNPWLNIFWLQQAPGRQSAQSAYELGRKAYLEEIQRHTDQALELYDRYAGGQPPVADQPRPDFNEYPAWSNSSSDRGGTTIDLFLLHTQEGNGTADSLAQFLGNPANQVSYHYTVSEDYEDHGVTVVDVVDTDRASWSVLSANDRSINLCFAGSRADWSTDQWMRQAHAIDTAAYLAVVDCRKYGISIKILAPPYKSDPPGISDHKYVTEYLGDGTHTDVGPNFPWPYFAERVRFWVAALAGEQKPAPAPPPPAPVPVGPADDQLTLRWACLGGQTLVEAVAELRDELLGKSDRSKTGAV